MSDMELLRSGCEKLGIALSQRQEQQFMKYYQLLLEWNQHINLTSITDHEGVMKKHFLDSLCLVGFLSLEEMGQKKIIDVGTGAGFPGIPLKIIYPDIQLTLLDSLNKRIKFLNALTEELELNGVTAVHARAEEAGKSKEYREQFDLCVSRAVAHLSVLSEYCIPFIRLNGDFVAYKSGNIQEEFEESQNAIDILGGSIEEKVDFTIPCSDMKRTFIHIQKIRKTPKKYPRKSGTPGKLPLL